MFVIFLLLGFASIHFPFFSFGNVGTYTLKPSDLFILLALGAFAYDAIFKPEKLSYQPNVIIVPVLAFVFFCTISGIQPLLDDNGYKLTQFFKTYAHFWELLSVFFLSFLYRDQEKKIYDFFRIWMVVAVISNIYSLYLLPARLFDWPLAFLDFSVSTGGERTGGEKLGQIVLSFEGFFRTTSFFSEPSALANFNNINILFYLAHSLVLGRSPFKTKFFTYLFLITWIPSQLFTFSLTAVLLLVGTAISYIFIKGSAFLGRLLKIILYFTLFAVIADVIQASITGISVIELFYTRIAGILDIAGSAGIVGESAFDRFYSYELSWLIWYNYPFFGTGLGLTYLNGLYEVAFLHNSISAVLAETGLWGMLSYITIQLIFPIVMIFNSRKIIRAGFHLEHRILSVLYMFFATVSLCMALLNFLSMNSVISEWYWFIMSFTIIVHLSYLRAKSNLPLSLDNTISSHSVA